MVTIQLVIMSLLSASGYAFFDLAGNRFMGYFSVFVVIAITLADITHSWGIW